MKLDNATLKRFLAIKAEKARLEKEEKAISAAIKENGAFETSEFTVDLVPVQKFITIDADTLCTVLDPVLVSEKNLIKEINYDLVQVKPKLKKVA